MPTVPRMAQSKPLTGASEYTPSPTASTTSRPRRPPRQRSSARRSAAPVPSRRDAASPIIRPSTSTVSPRNSARNTLTYSSTRRPRQRSLPEHRPHGESGADDDREAPGCDVLDRRDRRRGGEHMAQVRDHEHASPMCSVLSATRASVTQTSQYNQGECVQVDTPVPAPRHAAPTRRCAVPGGKLQVKSIVTTSASSAPTECRTGRRLGRFDLEQALLVEHVEQPERRQDHDRGNDEHDEDRNEGRVGCGGLRHLQRRREHVRPLTRPPTRSRWMRPHRWRGHARSGASCGGATPVSRCRRSTR